MKTGELITIHNKLTDLKSNIRTQVSNIGTVCDGNDIDNITDAILEVVLNWLGNNIEEIEFKE